VWAGCVAEGLWRAIGVFDAELGEEGGGVCRAALDFDVRDANVRVIGTAEAASDVAVDARERGA
jgi:hypothetical protein